MPGACRWTPIGNHIMPYVSGYSLGWEGGLETPPMRVCPLRVAYVVHQGRSVVEIVHEEDPLGALETELKTAPYEWAVSLAYAFENVGRIVRERSSRSEDTHSTIPQNVPDNDHRPVVLRARTGLPCLRRTARSRGSSHIKIGQLDSLTKSSCGRSWIDHIAPMSRTCPCASCCYTMSLTKRLRATSLYHRSRGSH
ncbi:hypothetical protein K458DRAFT_92363 [Lentithecium fluviatile CBS 122367]|uniref:Uncharacterized protein n=1 Tax=Lentithecium fluviatile CBS 122367 TaxID=1168545 RepID=A0A6G1IQJ7_9PLEO|nr:hypothetical protein K458DRAFT_92363 [Lentithecium fluviatile CBS 122367]